MPANAYPPSNLASSSTTVPVVLTWGRATSAVSYNIYRDARRIGNVAAPTLTYSDAAVTVNSRHRYVVTGVDSSGRESDGVALDVQIEPTGQLTFQVTWDPQPGHVPPPQPRWRWQ